MERNDLDRVSFDKNPFVVIWEMTRSCALKCVHCRAEALDKRDPEELTLCQSFRLLDEIRHFGRPLTVLTGGDPMRHSAVFDVVEYGAAIGLRMAMTPSGTDEMTPDIVKKLKNKGLSRLAVSLDGSNTALHDGFRKVQGSFEWTLNILRWAREIGLSTQINTTITKHNIHDIDNLCELMGSFGISLWSVFFLVPTGRGRLEDGIGARDYEKVFHKMAEVSEKNLFQVKSTEAPHYRRVLLQRRSARLADAPAAGRAPMGVNDGKGFVFISHKGEIYPSGFLPISAGNVKRDSLVDVYRNSDIFKTLRDPSKLKGKCGACEYKNICGGSRARAYAVSGDYMQGEPCCSYVPKGYFVTDEDWRYW